MSARGTFIAEGFSQRLLLQFYDKNLTNVVVNRDYEGEISKAGSKLNILNFDKITEKDYTGADLTPDDITENETELVIDKKKAFYFKLKTIDNFLSYIKDPKSTVINQKNNERSKNVDTFTFGLYGDVGAGNRVGVDYTTGTITVDVTTGVVTGSGTTFTSSMVARGFKATGHTKWYRVKSFSNTTSLVIEDDLDDIDSAYTGGAIAGGATYTIEAVTPVAITSANLLSKIAQLKLKLDEAEANGHASVPDEDRVLIVPPIFETVLISASGIALHVPAVYEELVKAGMITMLQGFKVFTSNRLTGNNTDGFRVLAIQKSWCTFAEKMLEVGMEEDLIGNFGSAYKDLFVYGAKVPDLRRNFASEGFFTFTVA